MQGSEPTTGSGAPSGLESLLVAQLSEAAIFADRDGVIRLWNDSAVAIFGFSREEALGRSLDLIIPERLRPAHWQGYHRAIARGATQHGRRSAITRALTGTGETIYVDMSFAVICDSHGGALGSLAIAREATERYRQDKALRERLATLEQAAADRAGS